MNITNQEEEIEERIPIMKTPVALMETGMVIHQTEEMEDH